MSNTSGREFGKDFSSIPTKVSGGEVIEILDDNEEDAIDEYEQEEVLVKMEPDREAERAEAGAQVHQMVQEGQIGLELQIDNLKTMSCTSP
jgi:hypothetical protein